MIRNFVNYLAVRHYATPNSKPFETFATTDANSGVIDGLNNSVRVRALAEFLGALVFNILIILAILLFGKFLWNAIFTSQTFSAPLVSGFNECTSIGQLVCLFFFIKLYF